MAEVTDDAARLTPMARRRLRMTERLRDANFAAAIYGQIIVLSLLAVLGGHEEHPSHETVLATVVSTQLVFWIAHAYAEILSRRISRGDHIGWREVLHVMEHEWPLVQAAGPTVVLMLIGLAGGLDADTGITIALWIGVAQLAGWGAIAARNQPPIPRLFAAAASGALGFAVVLLKVLVH